MVLIPNRNVSNGFGITFKKNTFLLWASLRLKKDTPPSSLRNRSRNIWKPVARLLSNTRLNLLFVLTVGLIPYQTSVANGVTAGTEISNMVIVTYEIDGNVQTPIESSPNGNTSPGVGNGSQTTFEVDRKIDLLVTGNSNANATPGDTQIEVTFSLSNEGNDTQEFSLIPDSTLASDDFDVNNCNTQVTNISGSPLPGVSIPTSGNIKLKADQQAEISVKCDIPLNFAGLPVLTGQSSLISLYATAEKNADGTNVSQTSGSDSASTVETVFADSAGTDDTNSDATHTARRTYTASSSANPPTLSIDKNIVGVVDPDGGSDAISGSEVTYKINIATSGNGFINNLVITDPTPTEMSYKPNSIHLDNLNLTDNNDSDDADFGITNPETASINLGSIAAGSQYEIKLTYIIN